MGEGGFGEGLSLLVGEGEGSLRWDEVRLLVVKKGWIVFAGLGVGPACCAREPLKLAGSVEGS